MLGKQCHRVTTFCINTCFQSFSTPLKRKSRVSVPGYTLAPSKRWSLVASAAPTPPLRRSLRIYTGRRSRSQLRRRRLGRPGGGVRYSCCMIIASGIRLCARPPCRYFPSPGDAAPAGQQQQQQQQPPLIRHGTARHHIVAGRRRPYPARRRPAPHPVNQLRIIRCLAGFVWQAFRQQPKNLLGLLFSRVTLC